jgi:hypothetical protein
MNRETKQKMIMVVGAILVSCLILEGALRLFILPSEKSYGTLFGIELPPYVLISHTTPPDITDRSSWFQDLIVDGKKITYGDLWGFLRYDPFLGYAPQENMISANGWWQTNNLGARATVNTPKRKKPGEIRMLVFGDSFAVGSRLPYEDVWSTQLDSKHDELEVVNFGVDGYSMGQSYLRYQDIKNKVDHDIVLLMFVPSSDLWRDINIRRDLGGDWDIYWLMPRYYLDRGTLKLVQKPLETDTSNEIASEEALEEELRNHLRLYDRFYLGSKYEEPQIIGRSIIYKLLAVIIYKYQRDRLFDRMLYPDSEALLVSEKIFEVMNDEVKREGKDFILVILPWQSDLKLIEQDAVYRKHWRAMVSSSCQDMCIDLSIDFQQSPPDILDKGYDGTHYGPKANRLIAESIWEYLEVEGLLEATN